MKTMHLILAAGLFAAAHAQADTVRLTDGTSLTGAVTQQPNGDYKVVTGAGEMTVAKDKVASVVAESSTPAAETHSGDAYIKKVEERRNAYGNEDGIPRSVNLYGKQLMFTIGQLNNVGDAFVVKDPTTGDTLLSAADLAGLSYGLAGAYSYTDYIALEYWGDFSYVSKDYTVSGVSNNLKLTRYNVGIGPKVQFATRVGRVESGMTLIPSIGLTPVWSSAYGTASTGSGYGAGSTSFNSSSLGASLNGGVDFQFGGAVLSAKVRYLMTADVTGNLKSSNTSALLPQLGVGFNF
jgi:hypothetical protein